MKPLILTPVSVTDSITVYEITLNRYILKNVSRSLYTKTMNSVWRNMTNDQRRNLRSVYFTWE